VRILRRNMNTSVAPVVKAGTLPLGTSFYTSSSSNNVNLSCVRYTGLYGGTSFFNMGTSGSTFRHDIPAVSSQSGFLTSIGQEMAVTFNQTLSNPEMIDRPFRIDNSWGSVPTEFNSAIYTTLRCGGSVQWNDNVPATVFRFYNSDVATTWEGSSVIRLNYPSASLNSGLYAFVVANGLSRYAQNGKEFIGQYMVTSIIDGFMLAGLPSSAYPRLVQLPRIEIKEPTFATQLKQPVEINLLWSTEWKKWDKQKYSALFPDAFAESESNLRYALLYSNDNGETWKHMLDDSTAEAGVPKKTLWISDANGGADENYNWDVSDSNKIPEGNCIIRLEAYRSNVASHYSYHAQKIYIGR